MDSANDLVPSARQHVERVWRGLTEHCLLNLQRQISSLSSNESGILQSACMHCQEDVPYIFERPDCTCYFYALLTTWLKGAFLRKEAKLVMDATSEEDILENFLACTARIKLMSDRLQKFIGGMSFAFVTSCLLDCESAMQEMTECAFVRRVVPHVVSAVKGSLDSFRENPEHEKAAEVLTMIGRVSTEFTKFGGRIKKDFWNRFLFASTRSYYLKWAHRMSKDNSIDEIETTVRRLEAMELFWNRKYVDFGTSAEIRKLLSSQLDVIKYKREFGKRANITDVNISYEYVDGDIEVESLRSPTV